MLRSFAIMFGLGFLYRSFVQLAPETMQPYLLNGAAFAVTAVIVTDLLAKRRPG